MIQAYIDKLAFIYIKNEKVLMTRSHGKDVWYIPGGKRELGESDEQALTREVKEELSVDIVPDSIQSYGVFEAQAHGKPEGTIVRMTCLAANFTGQLTAAAEIAEFDFFTYDQIDKTSQVDHLIFEDLKSKGMII